MISRNICMRGYVMLLRNINKCYFSRIKKNSAYNAKDLQSENKQTKAQSITGQNEQLKTYLKQKSTQNIQINQSQKSQSFFRNQSQHQLKKQQNNNQSPSPFKQRQNKNHTTKISNEKSPEFSKQPIDRKREQKRKSFYHKIVSQNQNQLDDILPIQNNTKQNNAKRKAAEQKSQLDKQMQKIRREQKEQEVMKIIQNAQNDQVIRKQRSENAMNLEIQKQNMSLKNKRNKNQKIFNQKSNKFSQQDNQSLSQQQKQQKTKHNNKTELKSQKNLFKSSFKSHADVAQIKTLQTVIQQAIQQSKPPQLQQMQHNLFYVQNPQNDRQLLPSWGFRYYLFRFMKYQLYFRQNLSQQEMNVLDEKIVRTVRFYCLNDRNDSMGKVNAIQQNGDKMDFKFKSHDTSIQLQYMEHFLQNLLPFQNADQFKDIFLEIGIKYFQLKKNVISQTKKDILQKMKLISNPSQRSRFLQKQKNRLAELQISPNKLYMILVNLGRLIFNNSPQFEDDEGIQQDYTSHRMFFNLYLDFFCLKKQQFQTDDIIFAVRLAKFLKTPHPQFLQFIKQFIQTSKQNYSTHEFLQIFAYLVQSKSIPYEYFYNHKGTWMQIIQGIHDYSNKKSICCIKFLQIFSRERFINCERIYSSLIDNIEKNIGAMESKELVRTLYYYSKTKYGINTRFLSALINRILSGLSFLEQRQFSLLVRSIGNLNYQSQQLVDNLKSINYEQFLIELKYGCENLGEYYQQILKEIEVQAKGKYSYDGEDDLFAQNKDISNTEYIKAQEKKALVL